MADPHSTSPKAGEKRHAPTEERKPPKVRRFDVKTRVPRDKINDQSISSHTEKSTSGTGDTSSTRILVEERSATVEKSKESDSAESSNCGVERSDHPAHSVQDSQETSVNKMLQTSLELQQVETSVNKEEKTKRHRSLVDRSIVDKLFQDFVTTKMKGIEEFPTGKPDEDSNAGTENKKEHVSTSIEEMNRLLDAEITSITSRSAVTDLVSESHERLAVDERQRVESSVEKVDEAASSDLAELTASPQNPPPANPSSAAGGASPSRPFPSLSGKPAVEDDENLLTQGQVMQPKGIFGKKLTLGTKKLGLSIGQESLARILGNWKNGRILEDGKQYMVLVLV